MEMKKHDGYTLIRAGIGLLFIWGGLGKLFGILGGPGLEKFTGMLQGNGFGWLGGAAIALALIIALIELGAGLAVILNKKWMHASYTLLASILLVALVLIHIPSGNWMNSMIHISLFLTLAGLAVQTKSSQLSESSK